MSPYDCEICKDTWFHMYEENGNVFARKCECYDRRIAKSRLKESGISEEFRKKGFKNFDDKGMDQLVKAKSTAQNYYQNFIETEKSRNNSILFSGQVGSGKTHLGTAICNNLLNVCNVGVAYMAYRNDITKIKQTILDEENYQNSINRFCNVRVLYIDDLLKGTVTEADLNILYSIINFRYINNKPIIISTEKTPDELLCFDEAVGSRIIEMCKGNIVLLQGEELNYRIYS